MGAWLPLSNLLLLGIVHLAPAGLAGAVGEDAGDAVLVAGVDRGNRLVAAAQALEPIEEVVGTLDRLDRLLRESDFVSLHVPLSDATRRLIGRDELRLMKPTAVLVNTSRGPVVDEAALAEALRQNVIAGAGLDVFEQEPRVHPSLLSLPQVVLTPHIGSASVHTRRSMSMMAVENAVAALEGNRPPNLVNPGLWDQLESRKEA